MNKPAASLRPISVLNTSSDLMTRNGIKLTTKHAKNLKKKGVLNIMIIDVELF